ncbi:MAG: hypothetical protein AAGJ79_10830 [Verrucomicrobiota bacterium]
MDWAGWKCSIRISRDFWKGNSFAYGANIGWINFRTDQPSAPEGVNVGNSVLSGFGFSANCGFINFGDGTPANGTAYANNSSTDFGVNRDASGNLSGFAYGANIGWINFGWAGPADANRPRFDISTGAFTGFAYSANCGWINLDGNLVVNVTVVPDADNDGILTLLECAFDTDPNDATSGRAGLPTMTVGANGNTATIRFRQLDTPGGKTYTVQQSTDAKTWVTAAGMPANAADQNVEVPAATANTTVKELVVTIPGITPSPLFYLRVLIEE